MVKIFLFMVLLIVVAVSAQEQSCEIMPKVPIVGEKFQMICRIQVMNDSFPEITFDKRGLEVISRKKIDASIRSTVRNGRIFTFKEAKYVFDLSAEKGGRKKIYNLIVSNGGKKTKHRDINFRVNQSKPRPKDIFAVAVPSKKVIYVGEGVDVNYYLYYRVQRKAHIIEEWPQIKDFFKREINLLGNDVAEMVSYDDQMYHRLLLYSHRLYPEKSGSFSVGRIKVAVDYVGMKQYGLLGNFGSNKKKSVRSALEKIDVIPLPLKKTPASFTGLVGEHNFLVTLTRDKYLVNEPIEIRLEVRGEGNLEQFVPPPLLLDKNLEEFDRRGEIIKEDKGGYKKIIDYTYLARSPVVIKARQQRFSYFDLRSKKYVEKKIKIPALKILGRTFSIGQDEKKASRDDIPKSNRKLVAPVFTKMKIAQYGVTYVNVILLILILILTLSLVDWKDKMPGVDEALSEACRKVKKSSGSYSSVFNLVSFIREADHCRESSLIKIIEDSQLSRLAKDYFIDLIRWSERESFDSEGGKSAFKFKKKYFKEFVACVTRRMKNENS